MRLGREFDALRVAFSLGTFFFGEAKESTSTAGRDPRSCFCFDLGGDNPVWESAHADDDLSATSARRTGRRACLAKPSFTSKATPTSMACGCPPGPDTAAARLELAIGLRPIAQTASRLKPQQRHPSACLTGPVGASVRWFSSWENGFTREDFTVDRPFGASTLQATPVNNLLFTLTFSQFPPYSPIATVCRWCSTHPQHGCRIRLSCGIFTSIGFVIVGFCGQCAAYGRVACSHAIPGQPGKTVGRVGGVEVPDHPLNKGDFNDPTSRQVP